jgi:hypothetical protein
VIFSTDKSKDSAFSNAKQKPRLMGAEPSAASCGSRSILSSAEPIFESNIPAFNIGHIAHAVAKTRQTPRAAVERQPKQWAKK